MFPLDLLRSWNCSSCRRFCNCICLWWCNSIYWAGATDILGSGYRGSVAIGITDPNHTGNAAAVTVTVGAGGSLAFNVTSGELDTVTIQLSIFLHHLTKIFRLLEFLVSSGATTDSGSGLLLNVEVGAA